MRGTIWYEVNLPDNNLSHNMNSSSQPLYPQNNNNRLNRTVRSDDHQVTGPFSNRYVFQGSRVQYPTNLTPFPSDDSSDFSSRNAISKEAYVLHRSVGEEHGKRPSLILSIPLRMPDRRGSESTMIHHSHYHTMCQPERRGEIDSSHIDKLTRSQRRADRGSDSSDFAAGWSSRDDRGGDDSEDDSVQPEISKHQYNTRYRRGPPPSPVDGDDNEELSPAKNEGSYDAYESDLERMTPPRRRTTYQPFAIRPKGPIPYTPFDPFKVAANPASFPTKDRILEAPAADLSSAARQTRPTRKELTATRDAYNIARFSDPPEDTRYVFKGNTFDGYGNATHTFSDEVLARIRSNTVSRAAEPPAAPASPVDAAPPSDTRTLNAALTTDARARTDIPTGATPTLPAASSPADASFAALHAILAHLMATELGESELWQHDDVAAVLGVSGADMLRAVEERAAALRNTPDALASREEVLRALEWLDACGLPRSLLSVYIEIYDIE